MSAEILFAEVPRFYAEVERAEDPELAGRPVLVGGDPRKRGLVQSASAEALVAGVELGMTVMEALERCPRARALPTRMKHYREVSSRLRACFRVASPRVEPAGLESAFLDPAEAPGGAEELGRRLQQLVARELGLPLRVGIAPLKHVARLAAEEAGDEGLLHVRAEAQQAFLDPLPLSRLPGVGPRTAAGLEELGARRVGDLAGLDRGEVERRLGNHGLRVLELGMGRGEARIRAASRARTLSQESTLAAPELDLAVLNEKLGELVQGLDKALALEGLAARKLSLKLRYADGETTTRSRSLARAVSGAAGLRAVAEELLAHTQAGTRPLRLLGVSVGNLVGGRRDDRQLDLFR